MEVLVQLALRARGVALLDRLDDSLMLREDLAKVLRRLDTTEAHQAREPSHLLE